MSWRGPDAQMECLSHCNSNEDDDGFSYFDITLRTIFMHTLIVENPPNKMVAQC